MILQLVANGFVTGSSYALVALGFSLIYNTTRIFHFAHAAIYTLSVYVFYTLYNSLRVPLIISFVLSIGLTALFGILTERLIYSPLIKRNSSLLIMMLTSLMLYIVIINFIAMIYGNESKILRSGIQTSFSIGPIILTEIQIITGLTSIILFVLIIFILKKTSLGKRIRAMRDNPVLISVIGINPNQFRKVVFGIGSSLVAVPAIIGGLDVGIDPNIGMSAFLNGVVVIIVGGIAIFEGVAFGAIFLGIVQSLSIWKISARWQELITFMVLIIFLILRPQGVFGHQRRIEEMEI